MFKKIKNWFKTKQEFMQEIHEMELDHKIKIDELRKDLIYKVSQERAAEILAIKPLNDEKEMGALNYKEYLAEAELMYRLRPWRDIISKFQKEQLQYIMTKSDGGEVGQLQQLVSRGGILFADYAEQEMKKLHVSHLDVVSGNVELSDEEKYTIFQ